MNTLRFTNRFHIALAIVASLAAVSTPRGVAAGTVFDLGNSDIQGVTGTGASDLTNPYATLDIVGDTALGQVTFTISTSAHNAGSPINADFNNIDFNTPLTLGTDFTLQSASNGGSISGGGNISSFGTFDYTVGGNGSGARAEPYTFTLQLVDFSKATASNFEVANGSGNYFAGHIYTGIGSGVTGFVAADSLGTDPFTPSAVPEPASLAIAAPGILAALGLAWYRRRDAVC